MEARGFRRLIPYLKLHKGRFAFGILLVPIFTSIQLYIPQLWGDVLEQLQALDNGDDARDTGHWLRTIALIAGLWLTYSSLRYLARYQQIGLSRLVEEELRNDLFRHLQRLPARFFDQARIGDLVSRSTQDVELLRFIAGPAMFFGVAILILLPGSLYQLVSISWILATTVLVLFGFVGFGLRFSFAKLSTKSRAVQDAHADISAKAQEDFSGIRVLHSFSREPAEVAAFTKLANSCLDTQVDMARSRAVLHSTFVIAGQLAPLAVIVVGIAESLPVSELFKAYLYMQMLVWPLMIIGWILQTWHRARAAADRLDEIFDVAPEGRPSEADTTSDLRPSIEARNLTFRYSDDGPAVLDGVTFRLEAFGTLGLVGPIGGGKSTIISLLARLYDPPSGTLFLGDVDVLDLPLEKLRGELSVAPQEPFLFSDTLRQNILFGADDSVDDGDIDAAVQSSRLGTDLEAFPDRIDQLVGERGVTLSGGQKQRASLARALIGSTGVLVLDDTLSAVDHHTEQHILENLRQRKDKQTTIVIAHRLEAVRHADLIVVLDRGRVIDAGTHEQLLERGGWYAKTWDGQQKGQAG